MRCSPRRAIELLRIVREPGEGPQFGLFEATGSEAGELVVFNRITDLNGTAADFAIFDIPLTRNRQIEDHGDFFAAVRTHEAVFHTYRIPRGKVRRDPSLTHPTHAKPTRAGDPGRSDGHFILILKEPSADLSRWAVWQLAQALWAVFRAAAASSNLPCPARTST